MPLICFFCFYVIMIYCKMKIRVFEFFMCFFLRMDQTLYFRLLLARKCFLILFMVYSFIMFDSVLKSIIAKRLFHSSLLRI